MLRFCDAIIAKMLEKLERALSQLNISKKDIPCLIGVSAGPDSVALAHAMSRLGYQFVVAHFNHMIRAEALSDANYVEEFANSIGMPYFYGEGSVPEHAKAHSFSIEEAARELRYQFLFSLAQKHKAPAIIVAHTANDQVETVLMHLLRGAGLSGLKGMAISSLLPNYHSSISLLRPALNIWREEITQYCDDNRLNPLQDTTNLDKRFHRNRIRHELISTLEEYNPNIKQTIWQMAEILRGDDEVLKTIINDRLEDIQGDEADGYCSLSLSLFLKQPMGIQRGILRKSIAKLRPDLRDIGYDAVDRAINFAKNPPNSKRLELTDELEMRIEGNILWVFEHDANLPFFLWPQLGDEEHYITGPSAINLDDGWKLEIGFLDAPIDLKIVKSNKDPYSTWVDMDQIGSKILLRKRQAEDHFQPLGVISGSQKLKNSFINAKIPRRARNNWPIIASGNTVHWIPGYRQSQQSRITTASKNIAYLSISNSSLVEK